MQFHTQSILSCIFLAAVTVQGHMKMHTPEPFAQDTLNNSPLNATGIDFPCKLRSNTYSYTPNTLTANTYHVGDSPTLSFIGQATHGGGSCQISLTTDLTPSKDTKWMVIHSIEGGCPANVTGNMGDNPNALDPYTFPFTIPDINPGRYTLAWTWFNRVGNREMYMNCAPVQILAKSGSEKRDGPEPEPETEISLSKRTDFPDMFVANIGNGCVTPNDKDIYFPNPGKSLVRLGAPENLLPSASPVCAGGPLPTAGGSAGSPPPGDSSGPSPEHPAGGSPTTLITAAHPAATAAPEVNTVVPVAAPTSGPPPADQSAAPVAPADGNTGGSISGVLSGACSTEGTWNCIGGNTYQRCASGAWSEAQPVAAGTTCQVGQSSQLNLVAKKRAYPDNVHRRRSLESPN